MYHLRSEAPVAIYFRSPCLHPSTQERTQSPESHYSFAHSFLHVFAVSLFYCYLSNTQKLRGLKHHLLSSSLYRLAVSSELHWAVSHSHLNWTLSCHAELAGASCSLRTLAGTPQSPPCTVLLFYPEC